jgi:hypothetical protein
MLRRRRYQGLGGEQALDLRRTSRQDSRRTSRSLNYTRHLLHCTEVSQQSDDKGHLRRFVRLRATSGYPPKLTAKANRQALSPGAAAPRPRMNFQIREGGIIGSKALTWPGIRCRGAFSRNAGCLDRSAYHPIAIGSRIFRLVRVGPKADLRSTAKNARSPAAKVTVFQCPQGAEFGNAEIISDRVRLDRNRPLVVQGQLFHRLTDEA